jgi:hypothetical protein
VNPFYSPRTSAAGRACLLSLVVLAAGCSRKVQFRDDAIGDEMGDFNRGVRNDFASERFDKLEAIASQIIVERSRFRSGSWKIVQFHWAVAPRRAPGTHWEWFEAHIKDWEEKFPLSATAHIAHARFLTEYAWSAQGVDPDDDEAPNIKQWAQPLFLQRMAQANEQLALAAQMEEKSPELWFTGLDVALGQGWSNRETKEWFEAGKAAYPDFWGMDISYYRYLLPRWYGGGPGYWRSPFQENRRPRRSQRLVLGRRVQAVPNLDVRRPKLGSWILAPLPGQGRTISNAHASKRLHAENERSFESSFHRVRSHRGTRPDEGRGHQPCAHSSPAGTR